MKKLSALLSVLVLAAMAETHGQMQRNLKDLEYARADAVSLRLDLYLPAGNGPHPLIAWFHGGAFRFGDKGQIWWHPMPRQVERGYAVASINYRLSGQAKFPALMHDAKAAIRWLRANAAKYQLKADRILVGGESAGGYISTMLGIRAASPNWKSRHGKSEGIEPNPGCYRFLRPERFPPDGCRRAAFLQESIAAQRARISRIAAARLHDHRLRGQGEGRESGHLHHEGRPPFLILHGAGDCIVPAHQSQLLHDALKIAGVRSDLHMFPDTGMWTRDSSPLKTNGW